MESVIGRAVTHDRIETRDQMIPKIIHQFWVGPKPPPMALIQTWRDAHPDWIHLLWTQELLDEAFPDGLYNQKHYDAMCEWNGKCDIARWEILLHYGGFFLDADARCLAPLDDYLLANDSFSCYENELARPGLIAAGYVGATQHNALMRLLVDELHAKDPATLSSPGTLLAWETVGPSFLTAVVHTHRYSNLAVYPSFFFIPTHYTGLSYTGGAKVYADQLWGSTPNSGFEYASNT
jgi:mannosyltransferase OCH1-like enzyme